MLVVGGGKGLIADTSALTSCFPGLERDVILWRKLLSISGRMSFLGRHWTRIENRYQQVMLGLCSNMRDGLTGLKIECIAPIQRHWNHPYLFLFLPIHPATAIDLE